jgi:hypothetical protein
VSWTLNAILSTRRLRIVAAALAALSAGCSSTPIEIADRFEAADRSVVAVRVRVQPEHRREAARYARAAVASLGTLRQWLGPYRRPTLTVVDPPWHGAAAADASAIVADRAPWLTSAVSMSPELATARAIARRLWAESVDTSALPEWFAAGLVEYCARRIVTPLFEGEHLGNGFAMLEPRYFGGFVPRFIRIRLRADADGEPLPAYRVHPRADPAAPAATALDRRSLEAKTVLTLTTLERWVGGPPFDAALAEFVGASRGRRPTLADFSSVLSAATGQDLSWLLQPTLAGSAVFDYAVAALHSEDAAGGGFETTVVVQRREDGRFTGAAAPRVGQFESGRGVVVALTFDDGSRIVDAWDGRETRRTLRYLSAARARSAEVDPERSILLDVRRTNNSVTLQPRTAAAATRWTARWLVWLQQVLLTCSALV